MLDNFSSSDGQFGTWATGKLAGGPNVYGTVAQSFTNADWHVTGTVSDWSGMNFWFNGNGATAGTNCNLLDASTYSGGVQLDISGNVGTSGTLGMGITFVNASGMTVSTQYMITVTDSVQTVKIPWASFTGGTIETSRISGISFFFAWASTGATSYAVDMVIDNIGFY